MINTYNESALHETLKNIAAKQCDGKTEQKIDGADWIFDVVAKNGSVTEIQCASLSPLEKKIRFLLSKKRNVRVIRPVIVQKTVETLTAEGTVRSKRKSPKQESVYSILRGMGKMSDILLKIEIEVIFVEATETRKETKNPVQLKNKSRRHLKKFVPLGKSLTKIVGKKTFCKKDDWISLLAGVEMPFTQKMLQNAILKADFGVEGIFFNDFSRKSAAKWSNYLLWLFEKMNLCKRIGKKGREIMWTM